MRNCKYYWPHLTVLWLDDISEFTYLATFLQMNERREYQELSTRFTEEIVSSVELNHLVEAASKLGERYSFCYTRLHHSEPFIGPFVHDEKTGSLLGQTIVEKHSVSSERWIAKCQAVDYGERGLPIRVWSVPLPLCERYSIKNGIYTYEGRLVSFYGLYSRNNLNWEVPRVGRLESDEEFQINYDLFVEESELVVAIELPDYRGK